MAAFAIPHSVVDKPRFLRSLPILMAHSFTLRRRVMFCETDLAGIMHFANFFRWMEEAEHAFYRSLGLSVHPMAHGATSTDVGWPRVSAKCDYHAPLKFEEEVDVELQVLEVRSKSVRYRFHFRKLDAASTVAALGELAVVSVTADATTRKMKAVAIPEEFRSRIEPIPS